VIESKRQQGLGNLLINAAKKYSESFSAQELWLSAAEYTEYYEKRGWKVVRKTRLGGKQVNVMRIEISPVKEALISLGMR
jgi:hypothetical protein